MNFDNIKELIHMINTSELTSFELSMDNASVKMSKNSEGVASSPMPLPVVSQEKSLSAASTVDTLSSAEAVVDKRNENNIDLTVGNIVKSPIVGTFYKSSSPSKPDFVKKGDKVKKGDVLCIVEAMKIMNEIVSEFDGEIAEIFVEDEGLVEYGQPLFQII